MAERRMFAKSIVLSDAFLDMPASARCLYFTLSMLADDDGFVGSPKAIMRQCGAAQDDMAILLSKRYVLGFDSGVIVIKHWRMNNYLRNDRYSETTYLEEKEELQLDEKGAYTERSTAGIPNGYQVATQVSIGKDSIGKDSLGKDNTSFETFWKAYPKKVGKDDAQRKFQKVKEPLETLLNAIERQKQTEQWQRDNGKYIPNPATWLHQGRWKDEVQVKEDEEQETNYADKFWEN